MRLSPKDQKLFPEFHKFLSKTVPLLAGGPKLVPVMARLTGLSAEKIRAALQPGELPDVVIVDNLTCGGKPAAGCFQSKLPDRLEVHQRFVEIDESREGEGAGWTVRAIGGEKLRRSRVTVLHELVHWADFKANRRFTSAPAPHHDLGSRWEWEVFNVFDGAMIHRNLQ